LDGLLRSEWETVIREACLGDRDAHIAIECLVKVRPQIDVAEELGLNRMTISDNLKGIKEKLLRTAKKLNMI
jgi:hypothetical protein